LFTFVGASRGHLCDITAFLFLKPIHHHPPKTWNAVVVYALSVGM